MLICWYADMLICWYAPISDSILCTVFCNDCTGNDIYALWVGSIAFWLFSLAAVLQCTTYHLCLEAHLSYFELCNLTVLLIYLSYILLPALPVASYIITSCSCRDLSFCDELMCLHRIKLKNRVQLHVSAPYQTKTTCGPRLHTVCSFGDCNWSPVLQLPAT